MVDDKRKTKTVIKYVELDLHEAIGKYLDTIERPDVQIDSRSWWVDVVKRTIIVKYYVVVDDERG